MAWRPASATVGTSVPELATAVVSKLRGHDEVGVSVLLTCPSRDGYIDRKRGFLLLALHAAYLVAIAQTPPQ